MNREDIIRLAREAGMDYLQHISPEAFEKVVIFAALVASAEREACAKLCDELDRKSWEETGEPMSGYGDAIRERT